MITRISIRLIRPAPNQRALVGRVLSGTNVVMSQKVFLSDEEKTDEAIPALMRDIETTLQ